MATDNDHWCTTLDTYTMCRGFYGLALPVTFDPSSNPASDIPACVSYGNGEHKAPPLDWADVSTADACANMWLSPSRGGVLLPRSGLEHAWPQWADIWDNPPYSNPTPFITQAICHMLRDGALVNRITSQRPPPVGQLLVPNNAFETAWGQALLWALGFCRLTSQGGGRTSVAPLVRLRDSSHNVPAAANRLAGVITRLQAEGCDLQRGLSLPHFSLAFFTRRLSFKDPVTGVVMKGNRGGSMLATWGVSPRNIPADKAQVIDGR